MSSAPLYSDVSAHKPVSAVDAPEPVDSPVGFFEQIVDLPDMGLHRYGVADLSGLDAFGAPTFDGVKYAGFEWGKSDA